MVRFIALLVLLSSCNSGRQGAGDVFSSALSRREAARQLSAMHPEQLDESSQRALADSLGRFLTSRPNWMPGVVIRHLITLHSAAPKKVEMSLLSWLSAWPVPGYYPLRDDAAAIEAIRALASWQQGDSVVQMMRGVVHRITLEDPRARVRRAIAELIPELRQCTQGVALLRTFLRDKKARYTLFKSAALALGKLTVADPSMVPDLITGLYNVRGGVSAATESALALGTSRGEARALVRRLLLRIVLHSRDILGGFTTCPKVFPKHQHTICPLYREAHRKGWLKQDPILFENAALRVLAHSGARDEVRAIVRRFSFNALSERWKRFMRRFSGDKGVAGENHLKLVFEATTLPIFATDLSVRTEALHMAAVGGYLPDATGDDAERASWTFFGLPTYEALALTPPTDAGFALFQSGVTKGACHITAGRYYGIIRAQALNAALEDAAVVKPLTAAWNSQVTVRGQWAKTVPFWQPKLIHELGSFKECRGHLSRCLTPHELYRLEVLRSGWYYASPSQSARLAAITPDVIMAAPSVPTVLGGLEAFALRPWDDTWEAKRRAGVRAALVAELARFASIGHLLTRCGALRSCYIKELARTDLSPALRAKAGRMLLTLVKGVAIGPHYHLLGRREREIALERFRGLEQASQAWEPLRRSVKRFDSKGIDLSNNLKFNILYYSARR